MLLLDSHVLLWVLDDSPRLGAAARARITAAAAVHVSAATVWELTIKAMLGRLTMPDDLVALLDAQGFARLDVTSEHAAALTLLPEIAQHDPFDRLLLAQAACAGLTLLTADRVLLGLGRSDVVDATL
jgi:PIN domain nuclease of toxin-antitoxin system